MKTYDVVLTMDAEDDLQEIIDFIDHQDGRIRADQIIAQFEKVLTNLESLPLKYHVVRELRDIGIVDFREAFFKPYRVVFRVEGNTVYVFLVCDGRRDMSTLLQTRLLRG